MGLIRSLVGAVIVVLLATTQVRAGDELSKADKARAKKVVNKANRDKKLGDRYSKQKKTAKAMDAYKEAIFGYMEVYSLTDHPYLLFKMAEVYRARNEKGWALRGFKKYLELDPEGVGAEKAQQAIDELEDEIAFDQQEGIEPTEDPNSEVEPSAVFGEIEIEEPEEPEEPEVEPEEPDEPEPEEPAEPEEPDEPDVAKPGRTLRYAGMGTAALGLLSMAIGIKFGLDASSISSELSDNTDGWTAEDRARIADGESAQSKMTAFTLIGTAAIIGGGVMYWYGRKAGQRAETESVAVAPAITPTSVTFAISGRF